MKRVHTPEVMDLPWFPSTLRTSMTNLIIVLARTIGVIPVLASLVSRAVKAANVERVVDLGSGTGGSMPEVIEQVRKTQPVELVMTDKFPSADAITRFHGHPYLKYAREPVDATQLASAPAGLKTMINCFHHMRPAEARAILESAHRERQPLLIYELVDNRVPTAVWLLFLPVGLTIVFVTSLFLTLGVRPLTARQLFFTYVIPLVPLFYAWDGQMSVRRIYTFEDMDELTSGLQSADYVWEKGYAKTDAGKKKGIYLLGLPR